MIDRNAIQKRERETLSPYACLSENSRGRLLEEGDGELRTCFQHDRDRIIHSKAFRRLMHKTQVFLSPEGDHFRTRLTHTLEVSQIARTIARGLALNEDLTEAIALAHDLGHTPFGHNGEDILNRIHPGGFRHNVQSLRVVDVLEDAHGKQGLNLTMEVRDGIVNHTGKGIPFTLEGQVVKTADRIAYINHDIDDARRSGVISQEDLPKDLLEILGETHGQRINTLVMDMITQSDGKDHITQSETCREAMDALREFMFINVYNSEKVKDASDLWTVEKVVTGLYEYYMDHPEELPEDLRGKIPVWGKEEMVKDNVAGMTDRFALGLYEKIFG